MKKTLESKKLSLTRETLKSLEDSRVGMAAGASGGTSCQTVCSCTTMCSNCTL
jgi:hypothetical protein